MSFGNSKKYSDFIDGKYFFEKLALKRTLLFKENRVYPLEVLVQNPAKYMLMYCNASSTAFPASRCFQFRKKVLGL